MVFGATSQEIPPLDEFERARVVMVIPIGRSTGKPRIFLFQRLDREKDDGELYYTVPSGTGAKEKMKAWDAALTELDWEMHVSGNVKPLIVAGGVAVYSAEVDDGQTIDSRKPGEWFGLDMLPRPEEFYKDQGPIVHSHAIMLQNHDTDKS